MARHRFTAGLRNSRLARRQSRQPDHLFFDAVAVRSLLAGRGGRARLQVRSSNFAIGDFWRFWVVHLWVEDFLELFTTIMVAFIFGLLVVVFGEDGSCASSTSTHPVFGGWCRRHDASLYSSGTAGDAHGPGRLLLGRGSHPVDVLPWKRGPSCTWERVRRSKAARQFPHRWAVLYLAAVGFWNFLGAGVFGFLFNLPVVSDYEIGTRLMVNHGHAATMGVYGMLAGLAARLLDCSYLIPERAVVGTSCEDSAFWSLNIGLAWMVVHLAVAAARDSCSSTSPSTTGYFEARELQLPDEPARTDITLEWLRLPGDVVFIVFGVLPLLWLTAGWACATA